MDRTINWGDDAADARYRTQDTSSTGGDFVVAEDLDGGTVLLEYDYSASEWVSRGPVNLNGNDITDAGSVSADTLEADTVTNAAETRSIDYDSGELGPVVSHSFDIDATSNRLRLIVLTAGRVGTSTFNLTFESFADGDYQYIERDGATLTEINDANDFSLVKYNRRNMFVAEIETRDSDKGITIATVNPSSGIDHYPKLVEGYVNKGITNNETLTLSESSGDGRIERVIVQSVSY